MSGLHVDSGNMNTQGVNTVTNAHEFREEINALVSHVENLRQIWKGTASETFKQQVDQQVVNLNDFERFLEILGETIIQGARHFDETESDIAAQAKNLY